MSVGPGISVIIRTKNEAKCLGNVLERLREQVYEGTTEVVVVDSGSTDGTVSIAERHGCRIVLMKPGDFSFGRALNVGIEAAGGEIMVHLSGHSVPERTDYLGLMVEPFRDADVAASYGRDIPWPEACPSQAKDILNHFPDAGMDGSKFSNANAAVRKSLWSSVRFDEALPACEDVLWARSVMGRGHRIVYIPEATVFHSHTSSLKYIFARYLKERRAITGMTDEGTGSGNGFGDLWESYAWQVKSDFDFAARGGYSLKWYLHIPLYRLAQGLGLYLGGRAARRGERGV